MALKLPKIDKTMHLVTVTVRDTKTGRDLIGYGVISPEGQRYWQSSAIRSDGAVSLQSLTYNGSASPTYNAGDLQGAMDKIREICEALSGT